MTDISKLVTDAANLANAIHDAMRHLGDTTSAEYSALESAFINTISAANDLMAAQVAIAAGS